MAVGSAARVGHGLPAAALIGLQIGVNRVGNGAGPVMGRQVPGGFPRLAQEERAGLLLGLRE